MAARRQLAPDPKFALTVRAKIALETSMDETVLIAKAQMRVLCRAAGLHPDTFEKQFDAVFDAPPEQRGSSTTRKRPAGPLREREEKGTD
jgi:hypothetical protein